MERELIRPSALNIASRNSSRPPKEPAPALVQNNLRHIDPQKLESVASRIHHKF